jgi:hypothetical protein
MRDEKISSEEAEALRRIEEAEERAYRAEVHGADGKPAIGDVKVKHTAKVVRDWVRSVLVPDAVKRMYDIGMGIQTFDTPTAAGNVVQVEAPPSVQQKALQALIQLGVPTQLGIVDGDDNALPGVFALGALDLDAARQQAHGDRYVAPEAHARAVATLQAGLDNVVHDAVAAIPTGPTNVPPLKPMSERIAAGEFTVVEIEEGAGEQTGTDEDRPPGPIAEVETPATRALQRQRERMKKRLAQSA